jgi:uncharacterized membrane protein HdeD (DUF308 family)
LGIDNKASEAIASFHMKRIQATLKQKQIHWGWLLTGGILAILGGIVALGSPFLVGVKVSFLVGWLMVASGFYYLLYTIESRHEGKTLRNALMTALYFASGIFMVMNPVVSLFTLTVLVGCLFFAEGLNSLSLLVSKEGKSRRTWLAISSVFEIGLGVYVLTGISSASLWIVGTLWGVHMIVLGMSMLTVALSFNRGSAQSDHSTQAMAA